VLKEPGSVGILIASGDSRKIVIRGAQQVRDAIASAFGPHGSSVAISQAFGGTRHSQRGAQIAQGVKSANPLEEKGIEELELHLPPFTIQSAIFQNLFAYSLLGF